MDMVALGEFLCLNYIPGERTLVQDIKKLGASTWCLYTKTGKTKECYWSIYDRPKNDINQHIDEVIDVLCNTIDSAVNIALRSDVPVTLFLSGGIDSSIIAESAVRQGKLKHAYCLDFDEEGYSEWGNAKYVADKINIELRRVTLSAAHLEDFLKIVEHADDPLADSSAVAVWALSREVAQDYKVIISGDGADELFGGYLTYKATAWHHLIMSRTPSYVRRLLACLSRSIPVSSKKVSMSYKLARFLRVTDFSPAEAHFTWNGSWLPQDAARLLSPPQVALDANRVLSRLIERHGLVSTPSLSQLQQVDLTDYLVNDILVKVDRMTMAHGLEARAPYLIPSVADLALSLPEAYKLTHFGKPKRILRRLAVQLYGPKIAYAKKQGFSIPIHQWLRGSARHWVEELLSEPKLNTLGVIDTKAILEAKNAHLKGFKQLGFELWGMMVLVAWYEARIQGKFKYEVTTNGLKRVLIPRIA
jgi:asparagine synthase (glutamine-hydrolysing)